MKHAAVIRSASEFQMPLEPAANDKGLSEETADMIFAFVEREAGRDVLLSSDDDKMVRHLLQNNPAAKRLADEYVAVNAALKIAFADKSWVRAECTRRLLIAYAKDSVNDDYIEFAIEDIINDFIDGLCDRGTMESIEALMRENASVAMEIVQQAENRRWLDLLFDRQFGSARSSIAVRPDPIELFMEHAAIDRRDRSGACRTSVEKDSDRALA